MIMINGLQLIAMPNGLHAFCATLILFAARCHFVNFGSYVAKNKKKIMKMWHISIRVPRNGLTFGKVPKGGGGHFQSKNLYCRFFTFKQAFMIIQECVCVWGGIKGRSELF